MHFAKPVELAALQRAAVLTAVGNGTPPPK
jgi:hypothetical protein